MALQKTRRWLREPQRGPWESKRTISLARKSKTTDKYTMSKYGSRHGASLSETLPPPAPRGIRRANSEGACSTSFVMRFFFFCFLRRTARKGEGHPFPRIRSQPAPAEAHLQCQRCYNGGQPPRLGETACELLTTPVRTNSITSLG